MGENRQGRQHERSAVSHPDSAAYDADIRNAIRYERIVAAKALIPLALVALLIAVYLIYH